jgi:uncharacterized membrane protein
MLMRASIGLSIVVALVLLFLLPYLFTGLMTAALAKLHISHAAAGQLVLALILGGFINIPITRLSQPQELAANPLAMCGLDRLFPRLQRQPRRTVIAVNVGAALSRSGLPFISRPNVAKQNSELLTKTGVAVGVTSIVCYFLARPLPGVGSHPAILLRGHVRAFSYADTASARSGREGVPGVRRQPLAISSIVRIAGLAT